MSNANALADRLAELLAREHGAMAEFLVALADFDLQRGWEELGYSSLFWFLHRRLGLSKGVAHYRGAAAELIQAHPEVVAPLRDGRLCLTSILELAKVLTVENSASILPRYFGLSRREATEVTASIRPFERPPLRDVVTAVMVPPPAATSVATNRDIGVLVQPLEPLLRVAPRTPDSAVPLDEELRRLHVTVSRRLLAKIDMARDALSHTHPGASTEVVLEAGIDLILARHRKRRGVGAEASASPRRAAPDRITADVKRRVWARDGGRCQWPLDGGGHLRLHHPARVRPPGSEGARRRIGRGQRPAPLPLPQPARRAPPLRRGAHGLLHRGLPFGARTVRDLRARTL